MGLVLSRLPEQEIEIGDDIRIRVVEIRGNKVRLDINAPKHVRVDRSEIADAKRRDGAIEYERDDRLASSQANAAPGQADRLPNNASTADSLVS